MRDKRKHRSIGFAAPFGRICVVPNTCRAKLVRPSDALWYTETAYISDCEICGGTNIAQSPTDMECGDCKAPVPAERFELYHIRAAFRTSFVPAPVDEDEGYVGQRRETSSEIDQVTAAAVEGANFGIATGDGAAIVRRNRGSIGDDGEPAGFVVREATQKKPESTDRPDEGVRRPPGGPDGARG